MGSVTSLDNLNVLPARPAAPRAVQAAALGPQAARAKITDTWGGSAIAAQVSPTPADKTALPALTPEAAALMQDGLLPVNFGELLDVAKVRGVEAAKALFRAGKRGPFSENFGNPEAMLASARRIRANPELFRLARDVRKGDLIAIAYNAKTDVIANATHGPFAHVIVCTNDGAPPEFIEAIGLTGDQGDPSCNKVRRCTIFDHMGAGSSYRLIRPAAALAAPERAKAVADAVAYSEQQLGKPYDYTFGENAVGRSFYCSSLGYYSYTLGAKLPIPLCKSADRDALMLALDAMVSALAPKDRAALMAEVVRKVNTKPAPTSDELVAFVVQRVLPACNATEHLAGGAGDKARLEAAIARFSAGKSLPHFAAASQALATADRAGRFKTPVFGALERQVFRARVGWAAVSDAYHAFDGSGLDKLQALRATFKLANAFLPYSEALSAFIFGRKDGRTRFFGRLLDTTGWLHQHRPFKWVCGGLPVRGTNAIDGRFISPTDLAWAPLAHADYNLKPGSNLDRVS